MRDYKLFISDIYSSINLILKYTENYSYDTFIADSKTIDAVLRNFEIIGDASKKIPDEFRTSHSAVNWKGAIALRNIIAHEYFGVDLELIWETIKSDIPNLKDQMDQAGLKDL